MSNATTAVVLARGLGTRMKAAATADLSAEQEVAAASGAKAMMPLGGRPFLDHVLSALADGGISDVCLVTGPEHHAIRSYYDELPTQRLTIGHAIQTAPRGTADAVLAARDYLSERPFVVINGDNYYPAEAIAAVATAGGNALAGFDRAALIAGSNIAADRVAAFALVNERAGALVDLIEKPTPEVLAAFGSHAKVSMNCFAFTAEILDACARIRPSARGELELPDAVRELVARGRQIRVIPVAVGVFDLASRGDVRAVEAALADREVRL